MKTYRIIPTFLICLTSLAGCSNAKKELAQVDIPSDIVMEDIDHYQAFFTYQAEDEDNPGYYHETFTGFTNKGFKQTPSIRYVNHHFTVYEDETKSEEVVSNETMDLDWDIQMMDFNDKYYLFLSRAIPSSTNDEDYVKSLDLVSGKERIKLNNYLVDKEDGTFYEMPFDIRPFVTNFYMETREQFPIDKNGNVYIKSRYPLTYIDDGHMLDLLEFDERGLIYRVDVSDPNNILCDLLTPGGDEEERHHYVFNNGDIIALLGGSDYSYIKNDQIYPLDMEYLGTFEDYFYGYDNNIYFQDSEFAALNKYGYLSKVELKDETLKYTRIEEQEGFVPFVENYYTDLTTAFSRRLYANGVKQILGVDHRYVTEIYNEEKYMRKHEVATFGLNSVTYGSTSSSKLFLAGSKDDATKNDTLIRVNLNNYSNDVIKEGTYEYRFVKAIDDSTVFYVATKNAKEMCGVFKISESGQITSQNIVLEGVNLHTVVAH